MRTRRQHCAMARYRYITSRIGRAGNAEWVLQIRPAGKKQIRVYQRFCTCEEAVAHAKRILKCSEIDLLRRKKSDGKPCSPYVGVSYDQGWRAKWGSKRKRCRSITEAAAMVRAWSKSQQLRRKSKRRRILPKRLAQAMQTIAPITGKKLPADLECAALHVRKTSVAMFKAEPATIMPSAVFKFDNAKRALVAAWKFQGKPNKQVATYF